MAKATWLMAALLMTVVEAAEAQVSAFRYQAGADRSGVVLRYRKSNLDGSHPADIDVFVAGPGRLESLKSSKGDTVATMVKAWLETDRLTVRRFESWRLTTGTSRLQVELDHAPGTDTLLVTLGGKVSRSAIRTWPWHSYDFDFASLGWALRHLRRPEGRVTVGVADPKGTAAGVIMDDLGPVEVAFVKRERWNDRETRRYTIDGAGLEQRGGTLWVDVESGFLAGFEIQKPDEEGFTSGKLVLKAIEPMTEAGWLEHQRSRLRP